jgi:hypothetical protein
MSLRAIVRSRLRQLLGMQASDPGVLSLVEPLSHMEEPSVV